MSTLLEKLSEKQSMKPESQQNMGTSCLHCPHANIHSGMGVWSWLQKKFSKMKAEKEPEEFEFGCEDLTKDWFDEISDLEEQEEKSECDETDFWDNEQDSVEPDSEPDKARTGGIWDWDSEDYWAYGESERSLLEMAHKDMLCLAGLLEVMDSLALLADTQGRELQSGLSDVSVKLKDKAIAIENRWNTFLNKNYEIRR